MRFIKGVFPIIIGTIILSMISLINGYPLVYSDTGSYIFNGWQYTVPIDRPIAYGLFCRLFGPFSLWTVIMVQNFLTSFLIYEVFKFFFTELEKRDLKFYLTMFFLNILTGIGWYSNQLMPDFFTPVLIISIFIMLFGSKLKIPKLIFLSILIIFSSISHFSHLLIATFLSIILAVGIHIVFRKKFLKYEPRVSIKRTLLVVVISCTGWIALPSVNYIVSGEFYTSKTSHAFFMASMAEKGILRSFLKENCNKPQYSDCKLCAYKNKIPKEVALFLWADGDSSVFNRTGGFQTSKKEYDRIIKATLTNPKYFSKHVYMFLMFGVVQLFDNEIGQGLYAYNENSAPYYAIVDKYPQEYNMYMNSKQNKLNGYGLHLPLINDLQLFLLLISFLMIIYIYFSPGRNSFNRTTVLFLNILILGIVINSFITAGLSSPYGRYQARVVWLLELGLMVFTLKNRDLLIASARGIFKLKN